MKHIVSTIIFLMMGRVLFAQTMHLNKTGGTVAIGSDGQPVNSSAALDVKSTTQGVLLPRLTTAQRTAISNPANGLLVFDSDTQSFWFRQNGTWVSLSSGGGGAGVGWQQIGANISNTNTGNVGVGVNTPGAKLSIQGSTTGTGSNTADFYNPTIGPNVSHIHYGVKGDWFIRSGASDGNVLIQDGTTGNVGIGTIAPSAKLHVSGGTILQNAALTYTSSSVTGGALRLFSSGGFGISQPSLYLDNDQLQVIEDGITFPPSFSPGSLKLNPLGGNVGIGTATPGAKLSVHANTAGTGSNTADFYNPATGPNVSHIHFGAKGDWYIRSGASDGNVVLQDGTTGNVGIGTIAPSAKLNVSTTGENAMRIDGANPYVLFRKVNDTGTEYGFIRTWTTNPFNPAAYHGLELGVPPPSAGQPAKHLMFSTNYNLRMVILDNGNVGIGINNPAQKLAVNGTIRARELIVETSGWPDYVFARTYRLRPLAEVEQFINTHHHLPGITPAADMEKNGVAVADVTTKMMQKIEELTLYVIRQEKQIRALQQQRKSGVSAHKPSVRL